MLHASWRSLAAHRLRATLTALAVALGVALMAGTYLLTDTINASYNQLVAAAFSGVPVVVVPAQPLGNGNGAQTSPITAAMVTRVAHVPGVAQATGQVISNVNLFGPKGKVLGGSSGDFVTGVVPKPFEALAAATGHLPRGPRQLALDQATAARYGLHIGQDMGVAGAGSLQSYRLVGTVRFVGGSPFAGAGVALVTLPQAESLAGEPGRFDEVQVAAVPGLSAAHLRDRLIPALPRDVSVRTNAQEVAQLDQSFASNTAFLKDFLLAFAYVSLFVGGFIILNTFSMTVAQRSREFGLLRAMGASRRQVRWSVVAESGLVGLVGGTAGLVFGLGLAPALVEIFKALGADLPQGVLVVEPRTVIVSVLAGLVVSVVAALVPAWRATRVPALAAMREGLVANDGRAGRRLSILGGGVLVAGLATVLVGTVLSGNGPWAGVGALVVFAGVALLSPRFVPPLARVVGTAVSWRGTTGKLARDNATRQPGRTALTASALMVGLALVTFVSVLAAGAKATINTAVRSAFAGDLIVEGGPSNNQGIPASLAVALDKVPGVRWVAPVDFSEAEVKGVRGVQPVTGVPSALARMYRVTWVAGRSSGLERLGDRSTLLTKSFARAHHLGVGSALSLLTASGQHLDVVVTGVISDRAGLFGPLSVPRPVLERDFGQSNDGVDFISDVPGSDGAQVQKAVNRLLSADFPQAQSLTAAQFEQQQAGQVDAVLDLVYVLLALAVVVSLLGLVNTLALAVHERRAELGLLRAVGASRRQVRQMVRYESVVTALIGAVLGLAVGSLLAATLARWLVGSGFVLTFPLASMGVLVVLAALAGVLAAVLPARRAARLEVLDAIATG